MRKIFINDIIESCGGVNRIVDATHNKYNPPITIDTVYKWKRNGIPANRFKMLMDLSDSYDANDIVVANENRRNGNDKKL